MSLDNAIASIVATLLVAGVLVRALGGGRALAWYGVGVASLLAALGALGALALLLLAVYEHAAGGAWLLAFALPCAVLAGLMAALARRLSGHLRASSGAADEVGD